MQKKVITLRKLAYKSNYLFLVLLGFTIPLKKELVPIIIGLLTISSLLNLTSWKKILFRLKKNWPILVFFTVMVFGLIHSENSESGWRNIETKLSLLIIPISLSISNINFYNIKKKVFKAFIEGCIVALLFGIFNFLFNYIESGNTSLVYGKLAYFNHNSYLALYLNFCIILLLSNILFKKGKLFYSRNFTIFLILLFVSTILILASKAGIICLYVIIFGLISTWIYRYKKYTLGIITLLLSILSFVGTYSISEGFKNRIDEFIYQDEVKSNTISSRIASWESSITLLKENTLFGVGTGDVQSHLDKIYMEQGYLKLYRRHLNAHNQFLQTGIALGLLGITSLLLIFFVPVIEAWKHKNQTLLFFIIILFINFLFESMLEKQEGVIFVSYFYSILFLMGEKKIKTNN